MNVCLERHAARAASNVVGLESWKKSSTQSLRSLPIENMYNSDWPTDAQFIELGRWLSDTPPNLAQGLSKGELALCICVDASDSAKAVSNSHIIKAYLECRLPKSVRCHLTPANKPGRITVEIRQIG